MTTLQQYPDVIARIGVNNLNDAQKKSHEFILKFSANLTNIPQLEKLMGTNETIRKAVNQWLEKVGDLAKPKASEKPVEKKPINPKRKLHAIKTKGKAKKISRVKANQGKTAQGFAERMRLAKAAKQAAGSEKTDKAAPKKAAAAQKSVKITKPRYKNGDLVKATDYGDGPGTVVGSDWDGKFWVYEVRLLSDGDIIDYTELSLELLERGKNGANSAEPKARKTTKSSVKVVKEKAPKPPTKAQKAESEYQSAKKVTVIEEEVKHLKTFIGLANKTTTKEKIVRACVRLQKAFTTRKIRATSTLAREMKAVESAYIDAAKKGPFKITVNDADLASYVTIVGGQKVYKSVDIVSRYVGWADQTKTKAQIEKFLKEIKHAATRVSADDPYAAKVRLILKELETAAGKASFTFDLDKYELSGLAGLLGCACGKSLAGTGLKKKGQPLKNGLAGLEYYDGDLPAIVVPPSTLTTPQTTSSTTSNPLPEKKTSKAIMSSHEVVAHDYKVYPFKNDPKTNEWLTLFGEPQRPFRAMLSGGPGSGKSTLMIQLGNYLAANFGKVLYVSSEEYSPQHGPSKTLADKINRGGGAVRGFDFANSVDQWNGHEFLLVDSVNHAKWTLTEMLAWSQKHPTVSIIMIFQFTKNGQFKGGNEWPHEVDTVIKVEAGVARTEKNRFNELSKIDVFKKA